MISMSRSARRYRLKMRNSRPVVTDQNEMSKYPVARINVRPMITKLTLNKLIV